MENMTIEINGFIRIRKDGSYSDVVSVLNFELVERLVDCLFVIGFRHVELQHGMTLMGDYALDLNMPVSARWQHTSGKLKRFRKSRLFAEFVDRGMHHHALDRNLRSHGWDLNRVPGLNSCQIVMHAVEQKIVGVHFLHQHFSAIEP